MLSPRFVHALVLALLTLPLAPLAPAAAPAEGPQTGPTAFCGGGTSLLDQCSEAWTFHSRGTQAQSGRAAATAVSPDGSLVFVTGHERPLPGFPGADFTTFALDAERGEPLWTARYGTHGGGPAALALSPDGSRVFVTGKSGNAATVAYDASTGEELWAARDAGTSSQGASANALAVSPDGQRVFVAGWEREGSWKFNYLILAYDAATGERLWRVSFDASRADRTSLAKDIAVSHDGARVFVTGLAEPAWLQIDQVTASFEAATGRYRWHAAEFREYYGSVHWGSVGGVAVSPDDRAVYVAGMKAHLDSQEDISLVGYAASSGGRVMGGLYRGPGASADYAFDLAVAPDGSRIYVAGAVWPTDDRDLAAVIAFGSGGGVAWARLDDTAAGEAGIPAALRVDPDGARVFVASSASGERARDFHVHALDATSGERSWSARYDGPPQVLPIKFPGPNPHPSDDLATDLALAPGGDRMYVTGQSAQALAVVALEITG